MNILWFLVVGAFVAGLQGLIFKRWALKKVHYSRFFSKPAVFEGQSVEMIEIIRNQKLLPVPWVRVESRISTNLRFKKQSNLDINENQYHKSIFFLFGYRQITRRHQIDCIKRGYYNLNSVTLTSGDLFGMNDTVKQIGLKAELLVYPQLIPMDRIPFESSKWQGDVIVQRWIVDDPFLVNGIREYRYGDSQKDIHWLATARTGSLKVKNHDYTASAKLLIYLNVQTAENLWGEVSEEDKEIIETGISYAASIANWAIGNGIEVGFFCNGYCAGQEKETVRVMPACSNEQLQILLETMARLVIYREKTFHTFLDEDIESSLTGMDILVISAYWSELLESKAQEFRRLGNSVKHLPITGPGKEGNDRYETVSA